jgi:methylenetetrahydrofolate reductase (NADPH)
MANGSRFSEQIKQGGFMVTAEFLPRADASGACVKECAGALKSVPSAVNVADNPFGVSMSSLSGSLLLSQSGIEPIYQIVTRDRNRIAIQSDLLGAAALGIKNLLCLSGYHQVLTDSADSANVYDIDSTQLLAIVKKMNDTGELLNGAKIEGAFAMNTGAVVNPHMKPIELNMLRLSQKVDAGASFIQTHAVFDIDAFSEWLAAAKAEGITSRTAIIVGVFPLESAEEAVHLAEKYTDFNIPEAIIARMKAAGDTSAQKREGIKIIAEIIVKLKSMEGLRGIHIISGGKETDIPAIMSAAGL